MSYGYREYFKGKNFMTPNVIRYGETDNFYYELSKGQGISGGDIYGVTVITKDGQGIRP